VDPLQRSVQLLTQVEDIECERLLLTQRVPQRCARILRLLARAVQAIHRLDESGCKKAHAVRHEVSSDPLLARKLDLPPAEWGVPKAVRYCVHETQHP
jgi:hypothetical protein